MLDDGSRAFGCRGQKSSRLKVQGSRLKAEKLEDKKVRMIKVDVRHRISIDIFRLPHPRRAIVPLYRTTAAPISEFFIFCHLILELGYENPQC
jgi:hypothetical protein